MGLLAARLQGTPAGAAAPLPRACTPAAAPAPAGLPTVSAPARAGSNSQVLPAAGVAATTPGHLMVAAAAPSAPMAATPAAGMTYSTSGALALQPVLTPAATVAPAAITTVDLPQQARALARSERPDPWSNCTPEQRQEAREKLAFLRQVWGLKPTHTFDAACRQVAQQSEQFPRLLVAGKHGESLLKLERVAANAREWFARLGWQGWKGREPNWDAGLALADLYARGRRVLPPEQRWPRYWPYVRGYYEHPNKATLIASWEAANADFRHDYPQHSPDELPAFHHVERWYELYADKDALLLARGGKEEFRNKRVGFIFRDSSALRAGQLIVGDDHQLDMWVQWPAPGTKAGIVAKRLYITVWLDVKSGFLVGCRLADGDDQNPNGLWVWDALNMAHAASGGVPYKWIYTDNGSNYLLAGLLRGVTINGHTHSILRELGAQLPAGDQLKHVRAIVRNARAKPAEGWFHHVCTTFSSLQPACWGGNVVVRPSYSEVIQAKRPELLPTLQQAQEKLSVFIDRWHQRPSQSRHSGPLCPYDNWAAREPWTTPIAAKDLEMAMLLPLQGSQRGHGHKVGRGLGLHVQHPYQAPPVAGIFAYRAECLAPYFGEEVLVKVDPRTAAHVWAFTPDGRLIGKVQHAALVGDVLPYIEAPTELVSAAIARQHATAEQASAKWAASVGAPAGTRLENDPAAAVRLLPSAPAPLLVLPGTRSTAGLPATTAAQAPGAAEAKTIKAAKVQAAANLEDARAALQERLLAGEALTDETEMSMGAHTWINPLDLEP